MNKSKIIFYLFVSVFLVLISFRYWNLELQVKSQDLGIKTGEDMTLIGEVVSEPDIRETNVKLTLKVKKDRLSTKILVTLPRYPKYEYGDVLKVTGKLEKPPVFEGFNYANYLKTKGISFVVYSPEVELIEWGTGSFFYSKILKFKNRLKQSIYSSMPSPESAIVGASILGGEEGISKNLQEKLNIAGVRHIIAVSGANIVIISSILMFLFLGLGIGRRLSIYLSLLFIFIFISLCAFQISAVRAGIMGSLFLIAPLFGRRSYGIRAIVISAMVMLLFNPYLLFYDVGFQLSFLATLGMIYLSTTFSRWLKVIPNEFFNLRDILSSTFSAYIFTLPILVYNFGQVSISGILANILILPVVSWIMILGFIAAVAGIFIPLLGLFISIIPYLLVHYLLYIVELLSKPWMALSFQNIHWFWLIAYYTIFILISRHVYKKERSVPIFLR